MKNIIRKTLKMFLLQSLKLANWQVFLVLNLYDFLYLIFVKPFIKEERKREKFENRLLANKNYHHNKKIIKNSAEALEAVKNQWKIRKLGKNAFQPRSLRSY